MPFQKKKSPSVIIFGKENCDFQQKKTQVHQYVLRHYTKMKLFEIVVLIKTV